MNYWEKNNRARRRKITAFLKDNPEASIKQVSSELNMSAAITYRWLQRMSDAGEVIRSKKQNYYIFSLKEVNGADSSGSEAGDLGAET